MGFLYTKDATTYDTLLAAIKQAEIEWLESKNQIRMKSATVIDSEEEMDEIRKKLDWLVATVKSNNFKGTKTRKERRDSPSGSKANSPWKKKDPRRNLKGPVTTWLDPLNQKIATSNATSVEDGGMDGRSVQWRET